MVDLIENKREAIADVCARHGVSRLDAYFDMLDELRALLGVDVDLVMVGAVKNRYIAADIERTKRALYAA